MKKTKNIFSNLKNKNLFKSDSFKINTKINLNDLKDKFNAKVDINLLNPTKYIQILQDKVELIAKTDNNSVILKQSRFWASAITWVLMGGTAFGIGWITIAKTDEVVIATGKLEPKGGVINVQMPLEGVAREVLVKEGDRVKKGQVLIKLDTEITEAKNLALNKSLELNNKVKEKYAFLIKEGAISELQYIQQLEKIEEIKSNIKTNLVRLKYQEIISPIDGLIFELKPKGVGFVAKTSEPVMQIVPLNNLLAKVEIESRTIGFVKKGKSAEISIDSYPARDFGIIEGKVTRISSDALPPQPNLGKGYRFPAEITLDSQYLKLKSGKKLKLQAGMSLTANIKLRKVTYMQLFLNKFRDKADSLNSI